jgi:hypothetical protein
MKLLTGKKSWLLLRGTHHRSSCDVEPTWVKKDECETVAITLFAVFSQGEVFGFVPKLGNISSKEQCVIAPFQE